MAASCASGVGELLVHDPRWMVVAGFGIMPVWYLFTRSSPSNTLRSSLPFSMRHWTLSTTAGSSMLMKSACMVDTMLSTEEEEVEVEVDLSASRGKQISPTTEPAGDTSMRTRWSPSFSMTVPVTRFTSVVLSRRGPPSWKRTLWLTPPQQPVCGRSNCESGCSEQGEQRRARVVVV